MGTDTIRIGTSRMFDMFQHQKLNKRFVYVFLEGVIITLFPQNKFPELFTRLHSQSDRVVNHIAKMKENNVDSSEPGARKRRRWSIAHAQLEVIDCATGSESRFGEWRPSCQILKLILVAIQKFFLNLWDSNVKSWSVNHRCRILTDLCNAWFGGRNCSQSFNVQRVYFLE